jgi:hypothetical protein
MKYHQERKTLDWLVFPKGANLANSTDEIKQRLAGVSVSYQAMP